LDKEDSFEDEIDNCIAAELEIEVITIHLALLAALLRALFWCLKQHFPQNKWTLPRILSKFCH